MAILTQEQADQLYLNQRAIEMRNERERRVVNILQGLVAIFALILIFRSLLKKKS